MSQNNSTQQTNTPTQTDFELAIENHQLEITRLNGKLESQKRISDKRLKLARYYYHEFRRAADQATPTHSETAFSKVPQTVLDFSDEGLTSLADDYLAATVKDLGNYQDYCHKMAGLAEAAMVRIESILNSRVGGV